MPTMERRDFLKATGLATGAVLLGGRVPRARAATTSPLSPGRTPLRSNLHTHCRLQ